MGGVQAHSRSSVLQSAREIGSLGAARSRLAELAFGLHPPFDRFLDLVLVYH